MRRGFFQDLALLTQDAVLAPELAQLLLLVAGQAIAPFAGVEIRLLQPQPQGLSGHAQLAGNLRVRFPARACQADRLCAKLRWICWLALRHGYTSSGVFSPKRTGVYQTGSTPAQWTTGGGGHGHVAYVGAVDPNTHVATYWEYNVATTGAFSNTGTSNTEGTPDNWINIGNPSNSPTLRIGALFTSGEYDVKEGSLYNGWVDEYSSGVSQGLQDGTLTGIVTGGGLYVKQGHLDSGWVTQTTSGAVEASISDASGSTPIRVAVVDNDGTFWVKEGPLSSTGWVLEQGSVVAGYVSGNRIAALLSDGTFEVKEGSLTAGWVVENGSVSQGIISGGSGTGSSGQGLIAVVIGGTLYVKSGPLTAGWITEQGSVAKAQLAYTSSSVLIGEIDTGANYYVKSGIGGGWVLEQGSVTQAALSGTLIGAVLTGGTYQIKQGIGGGWVTEQGGVAMPALWSPN